MPVVPAAGLRALTVIGLLDGDRRRLQRTTAILGAERRQALTLRDRLRVCDEMPLGSTLFTVMALSATDATCPLIWPCGTGAPGGVVGAPAGCLGPGRLPSRESLWRSGRTLM